MIAVWNPEKKKYDIYLTTKPEEVTCDNCKDRPINL